MILRFDMTKQDIGARPARGVNNRGQAQGMGMSETKGPGTGAIVFGSMTKRATSYPPNRPI